MDWLLNFFSDLILFTAGLVVITFWVFVIIFIIDELLDIAFKKEDEDA